MGQKVLDHRGVGVSNERECKEVGESEGGEAGADFEAGLEGERDGGERGLGDPVEQLHDGVSRLLVCCCVGW